jgi:hypothetical protein
MNDAFLLITGILGGTAGTAILHALFWAYRMGKWERSFSDVQKSVFDSGQKIEDATLASMRAVSSLEATSGQIKELIDHTSKTNNRISELEAHTSVKNKHVMDLISDLESRVRELETVIGTSIRKIHGS